MRSLPYWRHGPSVTKRQRQMQPLRLLMCETVRMCTFNQILHKQTRTYRCRSQSHSARWTFFLRFHRLLQATTAKTMAISTLYGIIEYICANDALKTFNQIGINEQ